MHSTPSARIAALQQDERPAGRRPILQSTITDGLPALQRHVFRLSALMNDPNPDLGKMAAVFRRDPSLAAQLLRTANSPYAKQRRAVWRLDDALNAVTPAQLRTLVLTCALARDSGDRFTAYLPQALCQHGALTAQLSQVAARYTAYEDGELAFLAGLIHDLGKVPLTLLEAEESNLPEPPQSMEPDSLEWEMVRYGLDHCETARAIAVAWNFPGPLIDVLEFHHDPGKAQNDPWLVGLVAAADAFCDLQPHGTGHGLQITLSRANSFLEKMHSFLPVLRLDDCSRLAGAFEEEWPKLIRNFEREWGSDDSGGGINQGTVFPEILDRDSED